MGSKGLPQENIERLGPQKCVFFIVNQSFLNELEKRLDNVNNSKNCL